MEGVTPTSEPTMKPAHLLFASLFLPACGLLAPPDAHDDDDDDRGHDDSGSAWMGSGGGNSSGGSSSDGGNGSDSGGSSDGGGGSSSTSSPDILTFTASTTELAAGDSITFSAVVTDPDGIDDLIGGLLSTPSGDGYGSFASSAQEGSYSLRLTWEDLETVEVIEFDEELSRTFQATFYDVAGNTSAARITVVLHADGDGYCDGEITDLDSNPDHCGSCDTKVPAHGACDGGIASYGACLDLDRPESCDDWCESRGKSCSDECEYSGGWFFGYEENCAEMVPDLYPDDGAFGCDQRLDRIEILGAPGLARCCCV